MAILLEKTPSFPISSLNKNSSIFYCVEFFGLKGGTSFLFNRACQSKL